MKQSEERIPIFEIRLRRKLDPTEAGLGFEKDSKMFEILIFEDGMVEGFPHNIEVCISNRIAPILDQARAIIKKLDTKGEYDGVI